MFTSRLFGGAAVTSRPSSRTVAAGVVLLEARDHPHRGGLPQPEGPSMEKNSPGRMARSIPRTAVITSPREWNSLGATRKPDGGHARRAGRLRRPAAGPPCADLSVSVICGVRSYQEHARLGSLGNALPVAVARAVHGIALRPVHDP